jgi:serine/threonine-protein kinase mTOR
VINQDEFQPPNRKVDSEKIKQEFDAAQISLKEDWVEWMRKVSVELLKQSPNPILYPCHTLAEVHNYIAHELFNISFATCWAVLNDK